MLNFSLRNYFFKKNLTYRNVDSPSHELTDVWIGSSKNGQEIALYQNPILRINNLDSFDFIRDLKSYGALKTRALTRKIVEYWIDENNNFFSKSFTVELLSNRIAIICMTYRWFAKSGSKEFKTKLLNSLSQQVKILELKLRKIKTSSLKISCLKSLIIGNIFLYKDISLIDSYLLQIEELSEDLILSDGGYSSGSLKKHIFLLRDLIEVRAAIASLREINTHQIHKIVNNMSNFFSIFCMPDNNFAFFNDGSLIEKKIIKETKKRLSLKVKNFKYAPKSGFVRITHKNLDLLIEVGNIENFNKNKNLKKASLCAFELYYKKIKVITNIGQSSNSKTFERDSFGSTAAHSSLTIDDRNNLDLRGLRKLNNLIIKKNQNDIGSIVEISHDGYKENFGVNHIRTIFISKKGNDIRGEDLITNIGNIGINPKKASIRFHLSPSINPIKLRNGKILLEYKGEIICHFLSSIKDIELENTIIFTNDKKIKSKQIIVTLSLLNIKSIKSLKCNWSFKFIN